MKKKILLSLLLLSAFTLHLSSLFAQTLNVQVGNVTYQFPAAQAGKMTYSDGTTLTVMGKVFTLSEVDNMYVDETAVTDGAVSVVYSSSSAAITVAGNVAQYLTITQSGAHVSIAQSGELATEVTYNLSGSSSDGEFYTSGSYKATIELNGLTLTNATPVYSGAAVHVQNGKRIKVKVVTGTTNTLVDAASGSQKGALYIKGHAEFAQKGTLNVYGNKKHGIKTGEYISVKNATINVLSAAGDGINCEQYFLMESGTISISGVGDDGLQCDIEDTEVGSTGITADHEDEDTGNIYIQGGTITINVAATAAKGMKAEGDVIVTAGEMSVTTTGGGMWDADDLETKAACGVSADKNITITGGTITLTSTGPGGKGMKCDSVLTVSGDPVINITTEGTLYYHNGTTENTNYTGDTDNVNSSYYSAAKGMKGGTKIDSGKTDSRGKIIYNYYGGIVISGGTITVSTAGNNAEGIESKSTLLISGGHITINAYDDAINAASDLTVTGGYIYARATKNDGLDANGNVYIKGGLVYAISAGSPEVAIDANTEDGYKLYVTGGTIIAIGGLERGASISGGTVKQVNSWTESTWYALYNGGSLEVAFKTPTKSTTSGGEWQHGGHNGGSQTLVVYTSSTPTMKSGVSVSGGTEYFDGQANIGGTVSSGSNVTLSNYSSSKW